jgi:hypothetical protein
MFLAKGLGFCTCTSPTLTKMYNEYCSKIIMMQILINYQRIPPIRNYKFCCTQDNRGTQTMRFGRYIVGLPSLDNETWLAPDNRDAVQLLDDNEDVNSPETSDADAIV